MALVNKQNVQRFNNICKFQDITASKQRRARTSEVSEVNDAKSCFLQKEYAVRVSTLGPDLTSIFHMGMKYSIISIE